MSPRNIQQDRIGRQTSPRGNDYSARHVNYGVACSNQKWERSARLHRARRTVTRSQIFGRWREILLAVARRRPGGGRVGRKVVRRALGWNRRPAAETLIRRAGIVRAVREVARRRRVAVMMQKRC